MSTQAIKYDDEKVRLELLPFQALGEVGKAFTWGAKKYEDHNYRKGFRWTRLVGSILRHTFAWASGENLDPESGLSHLAHAGATVLMLLDAEVNELGEDDRWARREKFSRDNQPVITYESTDSTARFVRCVSRNYDGVQCGGYEGHSQPDHVGLDEREMVVRWSK